MKTDEYEFIQLESELPEEIEPAKVYVSKEYECVKFLCPCGCGIKVYLRIGEDAEHPHKWIFKEPNTITPSIQQRGFCGSHYFITNGKTRWA